MEQTSPLRLYLCKEILYFIRRFKRIASLERKTHIANGAIAKWNNCRFSAEYLYRVANELDTSMDYLFCGTKSPMYVSPGEQEWILLYKELTECDPSLLNECRSYIRGCIKGYQLGKESSHSKSEDFSSGIPHKTTMTDILK